MPITDPYGLAKYPWEILPNETGEEYAAFITYRDLGARRTLRKAASVYYEVPEADVAEFHAGKIRTFERWSGRNSWVQRSEKYDLHVQTLNDAKTTEEILAMKDRHAQIAMAAQSKMIAALQGLDASKLNLLQMMQVYDIAVRNERLARGVPQSVEAIVAGDNSPGASSVTDESLDAKLQAWLRAKDPENTIELGEPDGADED